jgi:Xaa-Pro aminopeptidase
MRRRILRAVGVLACLLLAAGARASDLSDDLTARRARVMDRLGSDALLILWSAPPRVYSLDVDYEYRQDSNLYYLTGLAYEDTILVLMPGNRTRKEILFVKTKEPAERHWQGGGLLVDDARGRTGIQTVMRSSQFERFIASMLAGQPSGAITAEEGGAFFTALAAGRARVGLAMQPAGLHDPLTPPMEFARTIRDRFAGFQTIDVTPVLTALRTIKTPYEQRVLVHSLEVSSDAQLAGMRAARPGAFEYEVKGAIDGRQRALGAVSWSYPSIVGSGPNATILHYPDDDRQMKAGELLLVDAAANYQYMSGDITRTYPVSGTFTPAQKELYAVVLAAQGEGEKVARAGSSLVAIHRKTVEVIKAGLLRLGLITDTAGDQYALWFTHGATHYIGIDVHDVGDLNRPMEPGMAFVIEPGIYIRQEALDALPRTPQNVALIEKVQPMVRKYENIGIRIEDSFLLEANGPRRLSSVPRSVEEIEAFMGRLQPASAGRP